jgi:hypothetical protein
MKLKQSGRNAPADIKERNILEQTNGYQNAAQPSRAIDMQSKIIKGKTKLLTSTIKIQEAKYCGGGDRDPSGETNNPAFLRLVSKNTKNITKACKIEAL